ncbi:hypothetical protein FUA26_12270 [Seonamhaeicola algicola]|uniref:Uncharacterized protein n=1 Tax=Seonamhaeicola algicola TaxID=1719036 RepID=A0A5C7AJJ1_9FLAO|nr:hypothetical protein [Seonamhaeicola algicola]TXE08104.1 hypothetical protein FUA26_12270 [Seonamhaeicola algicola]
MNIKHIYLFTTLVITSTCFSQKNNSNLEFNTAKKGKFYVYWGWNRANYTKSDISFEGPDHKFTLSKVVAHDKPQDKFGFKEHLNPARVTIPQTNFRIGYFLNNKYSISFGFDHMKYVVDNQQNVTINGFIDDDSDFKGNYTNETITINDNFLKFEYTDGLNYINFELNRFDHLRFIKTNPAKIYFNTVVGIGSGVMFPRTNATFLGRPKNDKFSISGFGASIKTGINVTFLKHFFIQSELKGGYVNMLNSKTTNSSVNKAKHHFFYLQRNIVFGGRFSLFK